MGREFKPHGQQPLFSVERQFSGGESCTLPLDPTPKLDVIVVTSDDAAAAAVARRCTQARLITIAA
jgi:hypothetical protein